MVTVADIKNRFPEFANLADIYIQQWLTDALLMIDVDSWGKWFDLAVAYLTAHYIALAQRVSSGQSIGSGIVSSQSVGDISVSYATPSNVDTDYYFKSTAYGARYLELRDKLFYGGLIV